MKATSANILNDADALERKLNWQLFKQEIAFVWEYEDFSEDVIDLTFKTSADYWDHSSFGWWDEMNWRPGIPLHTRLGQICRRLYDIWYTEEEIDYVFESSRFWCSSCAVGWNEHTKICWMCEQKTGLDHRWFMQTDMVSGHPAVLSGVEFDGDTVFRPDSNSYADFIERVNSDLDGADRVLNRFEASRLWLRANAQYGRPVERDRE